MGVAASASLLFKRNLSDALRTSSFLSPFFPFFLLPRSRLLLSDHCINLSFFSLLHFLFSSHHISSPSTLTRECNLDNVEQASEEG
jgi:hypothetical protein